MNGLFIFNTKAINGLDRKTLFLTFKISIYELQKAVDKPLALY